MDRRSFLTTACAGAGLLSGCLSTILEDDSENVPLPTRPSGDWTQYGANSANTFALDASAPSEGNLAWTTEAFTRFEPVVSDGTAFITNFDANTDQSVIAIDTKDGSEQWRTSLGATRMHGSVLVDDKFVVAYETELVALDRRTGDVEWRRSVPESRSQNANFLRYLTADDQTGTVVLPFRNGFESFRADDGEQDWQATGILPVPRTPAIHDGTVYAVEFADESPALVAISTENATVQWRTGLDGERPTAAPVATDDDLLVLTEESLARYDRESGEQHSEIRAFDPDTGVLGASDGTAFVMTEEEIAATDIETGALQWRRGVRPDQEGLALGTDTLVAAIDTPDYTRADESAVTAFDRTTGDVRWHYAYDRSSSASVPPILVDGAVFFATNHLDSLAALGDVPARE